MNYFEIIEQANKFGYEFSQRLVDHYVKQGFIDRPNRHTRGLESHLAIYNDESFAQVIASKKLFDFFPKRLSMVQRIISFAKLLDKGQEDLSFSLEEKDIATYWIIQKNIMMMKIENCTEEYLSFVNSANNTICRNCVCTYCEKDCSLETEKQLVCVKCDHKVPQKYCLEKQPESDDLKLLWKLHKIIKTKYRDKTPEEVLVEKIDRKERDKKYYNEVTRLKKIEGYYKKKKEK